MDRSRMKFGALLTGLYAWIMTVFLGMVLVDILYARLVMGAAPAFTAISDFLQIPGLLALATGSLAVFTLWPSRGARNLVLASLASMLLEFIIPVLLAGIVSSENFPAGPWLRILLNLAASLLAFLGLARCLSTREPG
jgi:hypothetical protein